MVTGNKTRDAKLLAIHAQFMSEHKPNNYCNAIGIGITDKNTEVGIVLYFKSKKDMTAFPFKDKEYQGIPVYRKVIGAIKAL